MSDANRLQLSEILGEIFNHILSQTATSRVQDSAVLRRCVDEQLIQTASDALQYKLVDGLKYNDQVLEDIAGKIKAASITGINFVPVGKYYEAVKSKFQGSGTDRIALIYAEGNIVGGKNSQKESDRIFTVTSSEKRGWTKKPRPSYCVLTPEAALHW
jgi:protease-4